MNDVPLWPRQCICTNSRKSYAQLVRSFCRGEITNDEYEDEFYSLPRNDTAVSAIHCKLMWFLYDDLHKHRLQGKYALNRSTRHAVARAVLFLMSDRPADAWDKKPMSTWKWMTHTCAMVIAFVAALILIPYAIPIAASFLLCLVLVAWIWTGITRVLPSTQCKIDDSFWPFLSEDDFADTRCHPTFLAGPQVS